MRRDADEVPEALLQFQEHSNGSSYSQRAQRQDDDSCQVARREQTKACEQQDQPTDEENDERLWSSLPYLLGKQPA